MVIVASTVGISATMGTPLAICTDTTSLDLRNMPWK